MKAWKTLKPRQFAWLNNLLAVWGICLFILLFLYIVIKEERIIVGMTVMFGTGLLCFIIIHSKIKAWKRISRQMEAFIRRNGLYQYHFITEERKNVEYKVERIDYYPLIEYKEKAQENIFCIRIRLDGSLLSERFRELEQALADMFYTICTDKIEERGYLTYCFELQEQVQVKIESHKDILPVGEHEIAFSKDISWDWEKTPHLLLTGNTGTGKSQVAQYIITCLLKQGVRIIYCDPKNDDDMRLFMKSKPAVYVTKENDIARVVRETEEEVRLRESDLQSIGIEEAEFNPIFLLFDEMIAFAKTTEKRTYEETAKRLSTIIVTGRSKKVFAGMILQRPDTSYIEGAIRDNLSCRICMGQMSEAAYKMEFGTEYTDVKNYRQDIGSGLIYRQGVDTKPREFIAPYICKGALSSN